MTLSTCPGCGQIFDKAFRLKRHLDDVKVLHRRMDAEWLAQNHERCKKFLRRQEFGSVREMSYEVNQIASTEDAFAAFEGCGSRELERVGLSGLFLQNGVAWARDVPCVKRCIEETGAKPVDVQRFVALIAHSVSSVSRKVKATQPVHQLLSVWAIWFVVLVMLPGTATCTKLKFARVWDQSVL